MSFNKAKALKTASKYVQQGKYQSAIEEYRQIAQADAADVTTLNTLGDLYVKVGQTSEAIASFMHIAEHYRVSGFYLKAIAMLKKVSKLDTGNIEVSLKLAGLYAQQKLIVDARHQYLSVAEYYIREGHTQKALEIYQKIADLDPENTSVQIKLAEAFLRENQNDKAYDTFVLAAGEMRRQNKEGEALQTYLRALKAQPRGQAALAAVVNLYLERNEPHPAVELIQNLLADRPNDAELLTLLARIYQMANNLEAAEEAVDKMLYNARSRYQYAVDLAHLYVQARDVTGALRVFDRAIDILYEYREEEKAAQLLRDILNVEPQHLGGLTRLAAIYERTHEDHLLIETLNLLATSAIHAGSEPAAINALKRLLELEPDEIQHRRRLREMTGEEFDDGNDMYGARKNSEIDFWDSPQHESASFDDAPTETPEDFSSYSIQVEEAAPAGMEYGAEPDPQWGSWSIEATTQLDSEASADAASFFASVSVEPTEVTVTESYEAIEAAPSNLNDELESVDFYLNQGMLDVARYTLESIATRFQARPEVQEKFAQLREAEAQVAQSVLAAEEQFEIIAEEPVVSFSAENTESAYETDAPEVQVSLPAVSAGEMANSFSGMSDLETGYVATPVSGFDGQSYGLPVVAEPALPVATSSPANTPSAEPSPQLANNAFDLFDGDEMSGLLDFLDEFKAESEQHKPQEDFETHYNLGLAYKEMDMFEEAIEEFQQAFKLIMPTPAHASYVPCCSMLAFCFIQKGLPRLAVVWLKKGLAAPSQNDDVYQALRYDLADAYAALGEVTDAYNMFAEIYAVDVQYRGVKIRMQELAAQMGK